MERARADGRNGTAGPPGPVSVDALAGTTCTTAAGSVGTLGVEYRPERRSHAQLPGSGGIRRPCRAWSSTRSTTTRSAPDSGGFIEIYNAGEARPTSADIALVLVDGGTGRRVRRRALSGAVRCRRVPVVEVDAQNGAPDGVALIGAGGEVLLDALSYEGAIGRRDDRSCDLRPRRGNAATADGRGFGRRHGLALPLPERQRHRTTPRPTGRSRGPADAGDMNRLAG